MSTCTVFRGSLVSLQERRDYENMLVALGHHFSGASLDPHPCTADAEHGGMVIGAVTTLADIAFLGGTSTSLGVIKGTINVTAVAELTLITLRLRFGRATTNLQAAQLLQHVTCFD